MFDGNNSYYFYPRKGDTEVIWNITTSVQQ